VEGPALAPEPTFTVSVRLADPLAGGRTEPELNRHVTFAGRFAHERLVVLLNPLSDVTVQVDVALPPCSAVTEDGLQLKLKSAGAVTFKLRLNVRVRAPLVPTT
jgi:hypothetical protein